MIPRYLFRADSPGSDGCNDRIRFGSQAFCFGNDVVKTLHAMEEDKARKMLQDHGTLEWTVHLLDKYDLDENINKNLLHEYHEGEYLAEYQLPIDSPDQACRVPFSCVQSIMYNLAPDLDQPQYQNQLVTALNTFRTSWYMEPQTISNDDIPEAYALAGKFGGKWFVPIAVWALAMKYRMKDDVQKLEDGLLGMGDFPSPFMFNDRTEFPPTLRELKEWKFLMEALFSSSESQKCHSDSPEEILAPLARLQISDASSLLSLQAHRKLLPSLDS